MPGGYVVEVRFRYAVETRYQGTARLRTPTVTVPVADPPLPSEIVYVNVVTPWKWVAGRNRTAPFESETEPLAGCVTTTMVMHAAARGIEIDSVHLAPCSDPAIATACGDADQLQVGRVARGKLAGIERSVAALAVAPHRDQVGRAGHEETVGACSPPRGPDP